jgi:sporulation protein YunB
MINMKKITKLITNLFIIIVLSIICSFILTKYYSNKIFSSLYSYAETESKKITSTIINESLTKQLENELDETELYTIVKNDNNEIQLIDFNTIKVNKILTELTNNIEEYINKIENNKVEENTLSTNQNLIEINNGLFYNLPIGAVSGNIFLSNLGTRIPLKISIIGDVISNIETEVTEYGLNNALLNIGIKVTINTKVIAPFTSKEMTIENIIPVSIKVIQGVVPEYYLNGLNTSTTKDN